MDYFRILNLEREPFSNSPEPGLFCPSRNHVECLQQLEMAIRLKRGLNVVLGEVGTGKTTLCRKLIQQFAAAEDNERFETHLLLDPFFSSAGEFLSTLAGFFGNVPPDASTHERQFKEAIKTRLFSKGVDEGKIVVLLIDEGQKLPDFCVEILRELLNYETNDSKLLQIVIFAQTEFEQTIRQRANFSDRINLYYRLHALNFQETGRMIRYRIAQSGGSDTTPFLFTWPALYAVYRASRGYPRAINSLCHHVIMAMIIQNRSRVGWSLVRAGTKRLTLFRSSRRGLQIAVAVMVLALSVSVLALSFRRAALSGAPAKPEASMASAVPAIPKQAVSAGAAGHHRALPSTAAVSAVPKKTVAADASVPRKELPPVLGQLPLETGKGVSRVFLDIYGDDNESFLVAFARANPRLGDIRKLEAGTVVNIPAIPSPSSSEMRKAYFVQIARPGSLSEAHKLYSARLDHGRVMLFPYWSSRKGLVFALVLKERFPDRSSAEEAMNKLPSPMRKHASILDHWDKDTVFYRSIGDEA